MDIKVMESNISPKTFSKLKSIQWNAFKRNTHLIRQMEKNIQILLFLKNFILPVFIQIKLYAYIYTG